MRYVYNFLHEFDSYSKLNVRIPMVELVEKHDENHRDLYMRTAPNFPFGARDFVLTRYDFYDDNKSYYVSFSIDRDDKPPYEKLVRGQMRGK